MKLATTESRQAHTPSSQHIEEILTHQCLSAALSSQLSSRRCPTAEEWIKKMEYIYKMRFFWVIKKNEVISFAGEWMYLQIIISSKVNQFQINRCVFSVLWLTDFI